MSQYAETVKKLPTALDAPVRTDYRCAAHGCPNAASIDDDWPKHTGRCYFHWREPDSLKWPAITQRIRENFDEMRNHGAVSPERQAMHREASQAMAKSLRDSV